MVAGLLVQAGVAREIPAGQEPQVLTNLFQVRQLALQHGQTIRSFRLVGNVWQIDQNDGVLALHDDSGVEFFKLDLQRYSIKPGQKICLEGNGCALNGNGIGLTIVPQLVVENDGLHGMREKSGSAFLKAGLRPIRLQWFNGKGSFGLKVEYEGPGLPRQPIAGPALFQAQVNSASRSTNFVNGLDYRCYEGSWFCLPDFDMLTPVKAGTVTNFDLGVRTRDESVGLEFSGFVELPQDGVYNFYATSDDGSRLFVGDASLGVKILGSADPPVPREISTVQPMDGEDRQWVAVEGTVEFAGEKADGGELELNVGNDLMRVDVFDDRSLTPAFPIHSRVRAVGICQSITAASGLRVPGVLSVSGWKAIQPLDIPSARPVKPTGEPADTSSSEGDKQTEGAKAERPALAVLTTTREIKTLNPEEARRNHPVVIRGVITMILPVSDGAVIQDSTGGIFVQTSGLKESESLQWGEFCEIAGVTDPGYFAPLIMANRAACLGAGRLPEPLHPTWDQLINGSLDTQYAEIVGIVTAVQEDGIILLTDGGKIKLDLVGFNPESLRRYENALIRVRGCVFAFFDQKTHHLVTGSLRIFEAAVSVDQRAPKDPFDAPRKSIGELLLYDAKATPFRRIKVGGQIIYGQSGEFFLSDGTNGLRLATKNPAEFQVGDLVEAAGFLELGGSSLELKEAIARKTGQAPLPEPTRLGTENLFNASYNGTLVRVEALLVDKWKDQSEQVLRLQSGFLIFKARLSNQRGLAPSLQVGSRLDLTGVYVDQGRNPVDGDINSFELLLNSPAGIRIVVRPPWLTLKRLLVLAGVLTIVLFAVLVWNSQLRRQVEERTTELETEIRSREQAEQQRAAEAERSRIARDLHDDLGSGLTEVSLLAEMGLGDLPSFEKQAGRFRVIADKARSLVTALNVIVWAVNPEENTLQSFADYLSSSAKEFLAASGVTCRFKIPIEFNAVTLSGQIRHNLFLAAREVLNNVVRHARATEVELRINHVDNQLEIAIADNGSGFAVMTVQCGNGLANLRERLEGLGGRCDIESQPGMGTTIRLILPLNRTSRIKSDD